MNSPCSAEEQMQRLQTVSSMAGSEDFFGQQDDDLDLYDDFIVSNVDQKYAAKVDLKQHNEDLERDNENLKLRISNLEQEFEASKKMNLALRRNISVLYKTAKQEIEAKNSLIRDLQTRYDGLLFRRSKRDAIPVSGNANSSFSNNADSSPRLADMTTAKSPKSGCLSPSLRSNSYQTHPRHHDRSRWIHGEGAANLDINRGRSILIPTPKVHISNSPQNSQKGVISDTERVLAHYKRKAKQCKATENIVNPCVLPVKHNLETKMETCDKTSSSICCVDRSNSLEEEMPKSRQLEESKAQKKDDATNFNDIKHNHSGEPLRSSCKSHVSEPSDEKMSVSKGDGNSSFRLNGDMRDRLDKKKDGCNRDERMKTTEKAKNERHHTESSSRPMPSQTTNDRSLAKCKENFSRKITNNERCREYDRRNLHSHTRTDGHTRFSNIDYHQLSSRGARESKDKPHSGHRESRGNHKLSSSSMVQDRSIKYIDSNKDQRRSLDSPCKSDTMRLHKSNGARQDQHRTQAPRLQECSKKRKFVDSDSLPKRDSFRKTASMAKT